ncbi:Lantibiotic dehydratase, C terminus [Myxococcus fulvus]|uniref:Lantibiotic dehydratase n=1 Tax=Myxococcus fulvus TaxID=33 RepID=A0A511T793_MYXFU|nr:lantibiotic dehydratase [Myxococcus fulvus]GEN09198.1 lantibiotic dehydratase [Myxococcus fulvus]SEU16286.1 Lantibiotic dehydratase, C terminus [Myxococcus fulvus]
MKGWTLFPHLVVRATGFPFDWLERLGCPESARQARALEAERRALDALRAQGPRVHRPPRELLSALKAGRPVDTEGLEAPERFADWNTRARAAQEAEAALASALERELPAVETQMEALCREPRFLEAVASSSPPVARDLLAKREGSRLRRQVASYLQRLCAKNETMGFFGPINYGRVDAQAPTGVTLRWSGPETLVGRNTFAASWLVQGLVRAIAFDPDIASWLVPRRKAFAEMPARKAGPTPESVEELLPRIVELADGTRTLAALASSLGVAPGMAREALRLGCDKALLTHQLEVPSAVHHPVDDLAQRVAALPGAGARRHVEGLSTLLELMGRYGAADAGGKMALQEAFARKAKELWGVAPPTERGPASESHNFYQDRLPLREECGGDLRLEVGGERARELGARLEPALAWMAEAAWRTRDAAREAVARKVGSRTVPFWKVAAAAADLPVPLDTTVAELLAKSIPDAAARSVELGAVERPSWDAARTLPLVTSVDLLVGATDVEAWGRGDYTLVMGDIHDTALVWGWALQFHPSRAKVESEMVRALGALSRSVPLVTVLPSRRTGLLPSEFPGPVVELGGVSSHASAWRIPLDDLFVESDGKSARLVSKRLGSEVCLYNGELESAVHTAFSLPRIRPLKVSLGEHTPRVTMGGVVVQREQWRLDAAACEALLACKDDRARLRVAVGLWDARGLPPCVFAKFKGERKPVLVDVRSPPLLRVFLNLLEQKEEVLLSEMLPGPEQLWLRGPSGRHTVELRCTLMSGAPSVTREEER